MAYIMDLEEEDTDIPTDYAHSADLYVRFELPTNPAANWAKYFADLDEVCNGDAIESGYARAETFAEATTDTRQSVSAPTSATTTNPVVQQWPAVPPVAEAEVDGNNWTTNGYRLLYGAREQGLLWVLRWDGPNGFTKVE